MFRSNYLNCLVIFMIVSWSGSILAQRSESLQVKSLPDVSPTTAELRLKVDSLKRNKAKPLADQIDISNIGPRIMSGRVTDIAVNPDNPTHFYVAYASGGLFVTRNNGQTFEPVFDSEATLTIGAIAVDWKHGETIWVGTGESNSSRSSYAGTGIYKSTDKGKTWEHLGLEESHHIGRIQLHPTDPNIAFVAVIGHLYSYNPERGLYRTLDGGKTWIQSLYISPKVGAIDVVISPDNPNIMYCSMWERERKAWDFIGSGPGSGIYKSYNGGETWEWISRPGSGFPTGKDVGRIGLDISPQNPKIIYALLDNQGQRPSKDIPSDTAVYTKNDFRLMSKEEFLNCSDSKLNQYLRANNFPEKYHAESVKELVRKDSIAVIALVHYLEDANSRLFDTPIIGAELYRSEDGGLHWEKTHDSYLDGLYYTYGYYFGRMNVSPRHPDHVYIYGVDIVKSEDAGKTFRSILRENVHVDFQTLWINPRNPDHIICGNDGGLNMTYDDGANWIKLNAPAVSQFYFINVDNENPYQVYGGMQDNGTWYGPSNYRASDHWHASGQYPYKELGGGDGMQIAIDTVYKHVFYGYQFGHYFRKNLQTGKIDYITPKHELGERPFRWNWQTPIIVSKHNPAIVYMGSNHFHRSMDHGKTFTFRSQDLTKGGKPGNVPYGTLTSIDESPLKFGLLYVGSDDGLIHVSHDAGNSWTKIGNQLPKSLWVSRIVASQFVESKVYVALNGYRYDHFEPYLFISDDYGHTWRNIAQGLPKEPINAVLEDHRYPDLLYVGTDNGLYWSMDGGQNYELISTTLPPVAVHDLKIQKNANDLLVGTHGRSIYKINLGPIHAIRANHHLDIAILSDTKVRFNPHWGKIRQPWSKPVDSHAKIGVWSKYDQDSLQYRVVYKDLALHSGFVSLKRGIQYIQYNLTLDSTQVNAYFELWVKDQKQNWEHEPIRKADNGHYYLLPGKYRLTLLKEDETLSDGEFEILSPKGNFRFGVNPSPREERKIKEFQWVED